MKPFYAFEALYNSVMLDFTPQTNILTFNMAMLQIREQSRLRDNTELLIDSRNIPALMHDLSQLGYDVEQTSPETLHVRWTLPSYEQ